MEKIIYEILDEIKHQHEKWGGQNHHPYEWIAILGEEFGEVCKAAYEAGTNGFKNKGNWNNYRNEIMQVAALAIAMIENIDKEHYQNESNNKV